MTLNRDSGPGARPCDIVTFYIGEALCGIDVLTVQEINKQIVVTPVPLAPKFVRGVLNLRGQIITIIDLAKKLEIDSVRDRSEQCNIIVRSGHECIGFMVDDLGDVMHAEPEMFDSTPANISGIQSKFFRGVVKTEESLIGVLDVEEVLK